MIQRCPVCKRQVKPTERYPRSVCSACVERATDENGDSVEFLQSGTLGLLAARYVESGQPYISYDCWIDGVACSAEVHPFGGIIIEAV
jgi:hypothetical protein